MNTSKLNFIIDAIMFILMGLVAGLGLLIKYILLPGSERWVKYGRNVELSFWGLDRHQWGKIHLWIALLLILFLILHIIFHWGMIICLYKKLIKNRSIRILCGLALTMLTLFLVCFPFAVNIQVKDQAQGYERFKNKKEMAIETRSEKSQQKNEQSPNPNTAIHASQTEKSNKHGEHHHLNAGIEVKGYMSLAEISEKYNVPCTYLKKQLNLPSTTSDDSKLGHLRKKYAFTMSKIESLINSYKKTNSHENN